MPPKPKRTPRESHPAGPLEDLKMLAPARPPQVLRPGREEVVLLPALGRRGAVQFCHDTSPPLMKVDALDMYEPGPSLPAGSNEGLVRNVLLPSREAVERLSEVLGLSETGVGRSRLSGCDRVVVLAPRAKKLRRIVEAWLVAFARGDEVLLLTAPASEESLRHLVLFPEPCRRLVESFGVLCSPYLGITGMVFPRAVESARQDLELPARFRGAMPFFYHGNGDWDLFLDGGESIGRYDHEQGTVTPVADRLGQWFDLRYLDCLS